MAAWLSSGELLAAAIAAIAVSSWLTRGSRSRLAALGIGLVVAAQLLSIFRLDFLPLFSLRVVAGVGAGLAGAAATAAAAGSRNPERLFGAIGLVVALLGAITVGPIGIAIEAYGAAGAFASAALLTAIAFPMLRSLDPRGRWATIGTGLAGIGGALGPALTGGLVEDQGYFVLRTIVVGTGLFAALLLTPVLRQIDRGKFQRPMSPRLGRTGNSIP